MSSSRPNVGRDTVSASTSNSAQKIDAGGAPTLFPLDEAAVAGSLNDTSVIRAVLVDAIKRSGKSRDQLADAMSYYLAAKVTTSQLNSYTAESRNDWRWPQAWTRAFCLATGDNRLLCLPAQQAGYAIINAEDEKLLEFARHYFEQKRAAASVARLEAEIGGAL